MKAINYFHGQGVVHRDLKPDNILLLGYNSDGYNMRDTRVKIIDFGLAKATGNKKVNLDSYCGTIEFIAPEIIEGTTSYNEKCDLWSIGVITYFMLSGVPPFMANTETAMKIKILSSDYNFDSRIW